MVAAMGRAGVRPVAAGAGWARPTSQALGNQVPAITGPASYTSRPGPGPSAGGQAGGVGDGVYGASPDAPKIPPHVSVLGEGQENFRRFGIQGFNDQLTVRDRHAYYDTGNQLGGITGLPQGVPNTYNNQAAEPPRADLRAVNRSVSHQIGSDATAQQDDLTRPYTWKGEQGAGWAPIYGGVPGLYQPYGTRGGVPYPIVDPTAGQGGREVVWSGPPHGLHSLTFPDVGDTWKRYQSIPQMRPGRVDRPSNSPQAGQSFSQTVQMQGGPAHTATTRGAALPGMGRWRGGR